MSYKIKPGEMTLTDFARNSILRYIARDKCPHCGKGLLAMALEIAIVFGGKMIKVHTWDVVTKRARNRQITVKAIALTPRKDIAVKYGLAHGTIRDIVKAGLHLKFPLTDRRTQKARAGSGGKSKSRKED